MSDCLFCKIIDKEIPGDIVFESDDILAFNDITPQAPHHVLIIPKKHIATLNDLKNEDRLVVGEMVKTASTLAAELGIAETGAGGTTGAGGGFGVQDKISNNNICNMYRPYFIE